VEGLKEGLLKVQKSDDTLEMEVPRVIDLDIKASIDDDNAVFCMEVSWRPNREENPDNPEQITQAEPAIFAGKDEESTARTSAKDNIREAAGAAMVAAKSAGVAVKNTAKAARALLQEGQAKVRSEAEGHNWQHPVEFARRMGKVVDAATHRARKAVKSLLNSRGCKCATDCAPEQDSAAKPSCCTEKTTSGTTSSATAGPTWDSAANSGPSSCAEPPKEEAGLSKKPESTPEKTPENGHEKMTAPSAPSVTVASSAPAKAVPARVTSTVTVTPAKTSSTPMTSVKSSTARTSSGKAAPDKDESAKGAKSKGKTAGSTKDTKKAKASGKKDAS
jgi:hypothetical protein